MSFFKDFQSEIRVFVIVSIVAVVVSVGVIFILKSLPSSTQVQPEPQQVSIEAQPTEEPTEIGISSWQTYRNEYFRFELRYPPTLELRELERVNNTQFVSFSNDILSEGFTVEITANPKGLHINTLPWANQREWPFTDDWRNHFTIISVAGIDALQDPLTGSIVFSIGPQVYHINNGFERDSILLRQEAFDRIISTFRFLESIDTSVWRTYRNTELGFQISYPETFRITQDQNSVQLLSSVAATCQKDIGGELAEAGETRELQFIFTIHSGIDFESIWEDVFGFELSYDGTEDFGGKTAYYFYQTAEMPIGSKFYLVERSSQSAIKVEVRFPNLVYNCTPALRHSKTLLALSDSILVSTFRLIEPVDTSGWQTYRSEEFGFEFQYPEVYRIDVLHSRDTYPELSYGNQLSGFTSGIRMNPLNPDLSCSSIEFLMYEHGGKTLNEWVQENPDIERGYSGKSVTQVNDDESFRFEGAAGLQVPGNLLLSRNSTFVIQINLLGSLSGIPESPKCGNALSTFRFIE